MDKLEAVMSCLPALPEDADADQIPTEWLDQLAVIYDWIRRGRLRELNGDRRKEWRGDGLHFVSYEWGKLDALTPEWMLEWLHGEGWLFSPKTVQDRAMSDALDEYADRLLRARERERAHPSAPDGEG